MAILSNQGRTIPELPSLNATTIGTYDLLLIQNQSSYSTKQSTVSEFVKKSVDLFTNFDYLKFRGPYNQFTGSIRNVEVDKYSIVTQGVPNQLRRLVVSDYLSIGYNPGAPTTLNVYAKTITFDQASGGGGDIAFIGNYSTSTYFIQDYVGGVYLVNSPLTGETIIASTGFIGNLTGNVTGNVTGNLLGNVTSYGTSNFSTVNITDLLTSTLSILPEVVISSGTINGTTIGATSPTTITGTTITANTKFLGRITGSVLGNLKGNVTGNLNGDVNAVDVTAVQIIADNIIANTGFTGDITGNLTGDVNAVDVTAVQIVADDIIANTGFTGDITGDLTGNVNYAGSYVLENTGPLTSFFYGSSSYSLRNISSSHAISASYVKVLNAASALTSSHLNWSSTRVNGTSSYSFNGEGKYSSYSSSHAFRSTYGLSASYALKSDLADFSFDANHAYTSDESSTLLQSTNKPYKFTYFNGTQLINSPNFSYIPVSGYDLYYISSSTSAGYLIIDNKANSSGFAESGLILSNNYNRKKRVPSYTWGPEGWRLFTTASGSLTLASLTGSYQFTNKDNSPRGIYPYFTALKTVNNTFYFWPDPYSYNTIMRDASVAIGLTPPTSSLGKRTKAKLHISVFSSSLTDLGKGAWPDIGTVKQQNAAIYVEYGSGSFEQASRRTFYVSGSGNMYTAGNFYVERGLTSSLRGIPFKGLNGKLVSFWGTGSHSVSSSYASVSRSGSFAKNSISSSYISTGVATFVNSVSQASYTDIPSTLGLIDTAITITVPPTRKIKHFKICGTLFNSLGCVVNLNGVKINNTLVQTDVYSSLGWGSSITLSPNTQLPFTIDGDPGQLASTGNVTFKINWSTNRVGDTSLKAYVVGYY